MMPAGRRLLGAALCAGQRGGMREFFVLTIALALCAGLSAPARASTASLSAQEIPLGLIPDVCTLARFPASALSFQPGLYVDLEAASEASHAGIFRFGSGRAGLVYAPPASADNSAAARNSIGGFVALPLGELRLGAALRGGLDREEMRVVEGRAGYEKASFWWGTLGVGLPFGRRGYAELALSGGQFNAEEYDYDERTNPADSSVASAYYLACSDADLSYGIELRCKAPVGDEETFFALLGYRRGDCSQERRDFSSGFRVRTEVFDLRTAEPRVTAASHCAVALRWKGAHNTSVTAGAAASYADIRRDHQVSATLGARPNLHRSNSYETRATAFLGAAWEPRSWVTLFGGLGGIFEHDHLTNRQEPYPGLRRDREDTGSVVRGGFRLQAKRFYADGLVNNWLSANDPFGLFSVGYRF